VRELNASAIVSELRREVARHEDTIVSALSILNANRLPGGAVLEDSIGQMKGILRGSEDNAIATFNTSHRAIKEAIKRAVELDQVLTEPRLHTLEQARKAQSSLWGFLETEPDITDEQRSRAVTLSDLLARETFFTELPSIEQHAKSIQADYARRFYEALDARVAAYTKALGELIMTPGWSEIDETQKRRLSEPFERRQRNDPENTPIPQLRADRDACEGRLRAAVAELRRIIDGERVVTVSVSSYFAAGIETEEQLEAALNGIREACARLIGAGKKVIIG
jgi:hypothetical protein